MKEKLKNREKVFGGWQSLAHPQITEIMVKSGVDFIGIDMEHSTINQAEAQRIIASCHSNGILCLPRVASHNEEMVKRLLDSKIDGVIFPMVENEEQSKKITAWCRYPPLGNRSYGIARAQGYGFDFDEYVRTWNDKVILIAQIETIKAVDNIHEILPYFDAVLIGPYDLSGSLGIPGELDNYLIVDACQKVIDACQKAGKSCGTQIVEPNKENVKMYFDVNYSFLVMASDVFILATTARDFKEIIEGM